MVEFVHLHGESGLRVPSMQMHPGHQRAHTLSATCQACTTALVQPEDNMKSSDIQGNIPLQRDQDKPSYPACALRVGLHHCRVLCLMQQLTDLIDEMVYGMLAGHS